MARSSEVIVSPEMSRPYFEREMRVGPRVIFQWDEKKRFGEICPECHEKATDAGKIIQGAIFVDEHRAAAFDLDFIRPFNLDLGESWTTFITWDDAEEWVLRGI